MVVSLLPIAVAAAGMLHGWPGPWVALPGALACLWSPGAGFARWRGGVGVQAVGEAVLISVVLAPVSLAAVAWSATGGAGILAAAFTWWALGSWLASGARPRHAALGEGRARLGAAAAATTLALAALSHRADLGRDLGVYVEPPGDPAVLAPGGVTPSPGSGWTSFLRIGGGESAALRLVPREAVTSLVGPTDGPMRLDLLAPAGRRAWFDGVEVVARAPGSVGVNAARIERGNAEVVFTRALAAGEAVDVVFDEPARSTLYVAASLEASRALDGYAGLGRASPEVTATRAARLSAARAWLDGAWAGDAHAALLAGPLAAGGGDLPAARACAAVLLAACACALASALRRARETWTGMVIVAPAIAVVLALDVASGWAGECFPAFPAALLLGLAWLGRRLQRHPAYG